MKDVAITTVKFQSQSGEVVPDLEMALAELTKTIEFHANKVAQTFGLHLEIEES